jgi:hypothetical protein
VWDYNHFFIILSICLCIQSIVADEYKWLKTRGLADKEYGTSDFLWKADDNTYVALFAHNRILLRFQ